MKTLERTHKRTLGDSLHLFKERVTEEASKIYDWYLAVAKLQLRFR